MIISIIYWAQASRALRLLSPAARTHLVVSLLLVARVVINWSALLVLLVIPVVTVVALVDILSSIDVTMYDMLLSID